MVVAEDRVAIDCDLRRWSSTERQRVSDPTSRALWTRNMHRTRGQYTSKLSQSLMKLIPFLQDALATALNESIEFDGER